MVRSNTTRLASAALIGVILLNSSTLSAQTATPLGEICHILSKAPREAESLNSSIKKLEPLIHPGAAKSNNF